MIGWVIVCPDGKERHYPYINHGDAECDAGAYTRRRCCKPGTNVPERSECPQGEHTVEPREREVPRPPGGQA